MTSTRLAARAALISAVSVASLASASAWAQTASSGVADIVVTAQRQAQSLQDVPIAITAFSAETLETQQINNSSDLQLSLPNVTFTKGNFTAASFTIRGIGDLCVGTSCDTATGIHVNDVPLSSTRLFESEFFDMERIEVLRGPQGTLFGRNATSGAVNLITARPDLTAIKAKGTVEYGNYDSWRLEGMVNVPLADFAGIRIAGTYLKRDGYTKNLFTGNNVDGRDQWSIRGTLRLQPGPDTTIDLIGYHYQEDSNRSRIQKQLCHRDPTGILGCQPDRLGYDYTNANNALGSVFPSKQFLGSISGGALAPFGLTDIYGPDGFAGQTVPRDLRTINTSFEPTYKSFETQAQLKIEHDFGPAVLNVTGGWMNSSVDSRVDYFLGAQNPLDFSPGTGVYNVLNSPLFAPGAARLFSGNQICVSEANLNYVGFINDEVERCDVRLTNYDQSSADVTTWSAEAHIDTKFDGPFNFLIGGIYLNTEARNVNYWVNSSGLDYAALVIGPAFTGDPNLAYASPFFNSETNLFTLDAYGIFGEAYFEASDSLKFTAGLRYSNDRKYIRDRQPLYNVFAPYGTPDATVLPGFPGYRNKVVKSDAITGRFVIDWKPVTDFTDDTLVYASYSRGYKSGGLNPPFNEALFSAPAEFKSEFIDAFEIGTKNTFLGGAFRANLSAFYYKYKDLQVSRIINRTSFNDNTDAEIWGLEGEFIVAPTPSLLFNVNLSYLKTKLGDLQLVDSRDPSGGLSDAVIIKDLGSAAHCVFQVPGNAALANAFVNAFNAAVPGAGLQGTVPVPGTNTTGAFSLCEQLAGAAAAANVPVVFDPAAVNPVLPSGVPFDLTGNELPNAPQFKVSLGAQYTADFQNGWNAVLRGDVHFTGEAYSRTFNKAIDKIPSYEVVNLQLQVNAPDNRFHVKAFVQNLFDSDSISGQYVTDASSGLFTNIFTLEPRRYGVAVGFSF